MSTSSIHETLIDQQVAHADRAALLVDASAYFAALRSALLKASGSIAIAGWDIDSRAPIHGESPPDDGAPLTLGPLLSWLVRRRRSLSVHVLLWDYSLLYALEREPLPRLKLDWKTPKRVRVCLDSHLPVGASHHEKIAIVDDAVAFCGGIDLTIRRWDRPAHRALDPDRTDPEGVPYRPFHDLQMAVAGGAARALAGVVRERWDRVAARPMLAVESGGDVWPDGVEPDFENIAIGIARTRPVYAGDRELRQIESAYLEAIRGAEKLIYIENQYLTAENIAVELRRRLDERDGLELVIVTTEQPSGWLEMQTMGHGRERFLARLASSELESRVRIVYPWVRGDRNRVPVKVHAKLMIVDDRLLEVGSANLNRRSMGVDRECNLLIDASGAASREGVGRLRRMLLGHHLGLDGDRIAVKEAELGSVVRVIDDAAGEERGLSGIVESRPDPDQATALLTELADPERPIAPEEFIGDLFDARRARPFRKHVLRMLGAAVLVGAVLALWRYASPEEWADPNALGAALAAFGDRPWSGIAVVAIFVVGSLCLFPVTVMIATTAVALGPASGFAWALVGVLASSAVNYACGRAIPESSVETWLGRWVGSVRRRLRRGGVVSVMVVRNVPVAPFTVVNVLAGASGIRFRDFMLGTLLGMVPGIAALTILGDRLRGAFEAPGLATAGVLLLAVLVWIGIAIGLQALSNRWARGR